MDTDEVALTALTVALVYLGGRYTVRKLSRKGNRRAFFLFLAVPLLSGCCACDGARFEKQLQGAALEIKSFVAQDNNRRTAAILKAIEDSHKEEE